MTRLTTPKEMRQRRDAITAIRMGPKHDWVYRAKPELGETDTGVRLFDVNKSFAVLTSFSCPGLVEPAAKVPALASGHVCGYASMAGSKLGIRLQHVANACKPNVAWMGYGSFGPIFGFNGGGGAGGDWGCGSFKPFGPAGGRTLAVHRSKAIDETGAPTGYDGGASFELCGVGACVSGQGTFGTSATDTLHVYSCEEMVLDQIVVYLRELTAEEEEKWRCYGALP